MHHHGAQDKSATQLEQEEREEREAMGRIVHAMRQYQSDAEWEVKRWEYNYAQLPERHKAILASQPAKFARARECISVNSFFIKSMLQAFDPGDDDEEPGMPGMLMGANAAADEVAKANGNKASPVDIDKVRYVLKNLARDWSSEGAGEREACYGRICAELKRLFAEWPKGLQDPPPRVLLPGTGLARLCCDVAGCGFEAQGNEFSYYMLITSSFILNATGEANQYTIYPWVTMTCNNKDDADQLRPVTIPDVPPHEIVAQGGRPGLLSMAAGDFVEVYSSPEQKDQWDCVAACFFLDTAHNPLQYLEVIHHCLKPGGYWINLGPLLYHWVDAAADELSIELSLSEIRSAAEGMGFRMVREEADVELPYMANVRSMWKTIYHGSFWTMQKI